MTHKRLDEVLATVSPHAHAQFSKGTIHVYFPTNNAKSDKARKTIDAEHAAGIEVMYHYMVYLAK